MVARTRGATLAAIEGVVKSSLSTERWLLLAPGDAVVLARWRLLDGVEIAEGEEGLWVRCPAGREEAERMARLLPARARYLRDARADWLRLDAGRVPCRPLPVLGWQSLAEWMEVELRARELMPGEESVVPLRLVRSTHERAAEFLQLGIREWAGYVRSAPALRLNEWRFAASLGGAVLVEGTPLPPLAGERFARAGTVAIPLGYHWSPAVSVGVMQEVIGAGSDGLVIWQVDGAISRIHPEQFVPATRASALATLEAWEHS